MMAALAPGASVVGGALTSLDARSTASVLRALGASISPLRADTVVEIRGRRRLTTPAATLRCGNSGTTARLMLGILAGHRFVSTLSGDASLRRRPMRRVTEPLATMGARIDDAGHDGLPLSIRGGGLRPLEWSLPIASAQVKSALLLAGAVGGVPVALRETAVTRDHTERMLGANGFDVSRGDGWLRLEPTGAFHPVAMQVPGDPSSAAFLLAAILLAEGGEASVAGVGLNPTRTGFLHVMARMGASIAASDEEAPFGEPIGDLVTRPAELRAVVVEPEEVPGIIDEIPMLACLAASAAGESRFLGVGELRVKESDRLALIVRNLRAVGVEAEAAGDDLVVRGRPGPFRGRVVTAGDHRIAMAFTVLGTTRGSRITVDDPDCAAVSFPGFANQLATLFGRAG
jgi:3-phosphoshikimate 1-carboxyvinyltransferase